jgi:uncharacterized cupredoxin-like copper-binding protein
MSRRSGRAWGIGRLLALAAGVALALAGIGHAVAAATEAAGDETLGPGVVTVEMDLRHSRFEPAELQVRTGTVVRFEVDNLDPIHHELIVGPPEVHATHTEGSHHLHPPIPGELSLGPLEDGMTFYEFDEPGTVVMACHLPGHVAHGMVGSVEVVP